MVAAIVGALASKRLYNLDNQANGMFDLIRYVSVLSTSTDFAMWRLRLPLFEDRRCRRELCWRMTLPVPVILNRLETAFRVLLRAIAFGIRGGMIAVVPAGDNRFC